MLNELLRDLYASNLWIILIAMPLLTVGWSVLGAFFSERIRTLYVVMLALSVMMIVYVTVFSRGESEAGLDLVPFSSFQRAKENREIYRSMLMNVLLFLPLGLSCPYLLRGAPAGRVLLTIAAGCFLSLTVEAIQLVFHIGLTETDDVLCNSFGTALGALSYPLSLLWKRLIQKRRKNRSQTV